MSMILPVKNEAGEKSENEVSNESKEAEPGGKDGEQSGGEEHPDGHHVVGNAHLAMMMVVVITMITTALWVMLTRLVARARCTVSGRVGMCRCSSSRPKKSKLR